MRASILRAIAALIVAVASVAVTAKQAGFPIVGGALGVRVGVPGAIVELLRAVVPVVVALLVAVYAIRFGIRALRRKVTLASDLAGGGKLLAATAWAAWVWLAIELFYRQMWLGWATLFGNLTLSLVASALLVVLCVAIERALPWGRAPRGVRHLGFAVVVVLTLATALSAWSHRHVVHGAALVLVAMAGLLLLASGVRRVDGGAAGRTLVELSLASTLLCGPLWSVLS